MGAGFQPGSCRRLFVDLDELAVSLKIPSAERRLSAPGVQVLPPPVSAIAAYLRVASQEVYAN
jgi:hypothetical protein